jgi:hypothetical protein
MSLVNNFKPVIAFLWNDETKNYYIKNLGKGTAMNIIVYYKDDRKSRKWKNPVNCFSLEPNGLIQLDWGLDDHGNLRKKNTTGDKYLNGVTKIVAVYTSTLGFVNIRYYSKCQHDKTISRLNCRPYRWKHCKVDRIYDLARKSIN